MERLQEAFKQLLAILRDARGVTLYEAVAVVATTMVVAAIALPFVMSQIENAKQARAANEIVAIANAMTRFFDHTGRWPGEVEIRRTGSQICFLQTGRPGTNPSQWTLLPDTSQLPVSPTTRTQLLDARDFLARPCDTLSPLNVLNLYDFLVRKPSEAEYPGWAGPYMEPIASDPWDRAYVINVIPLIFSSDIADPGVGRVSDTGGKLGFSWVITAGPDRLLQTTLTAAELSSNSDDVGKNLGTRIVRSVGGQSASGLSTPSPSGTAPATR